MLILIINLNILNHLQPGSQSSVVLYDTIANTPSSYNCTSYLHGQNGYVDISQLVSVVARPESRGALEYICELLLKVTGGQANVENK